jgi:hypothetical protein
MFKKILLSLALSTALVCGAEAATVTQVKNSVLPPPIGSTAGNIGEVLVNETTVATFTALQDVATVNLSPGLWQCIGVANMGSETNASVISVGLSDTLNTLATSAKPFQFASNSVQTTQANATAGFPTATTGLAFFAVPPGQGTATVPFIVHMVMSQTVTDTVTAALSCVQLK